MAGAALGEYDVLTVLGHVVEIGGLGVGEVPEGVQMTIFVWGGEKDVADAGAEGHVEGVDGVKGNGDHFLAVSLPDSVHDDVGTTLGSNTKLDPSEVFFAEAFHAGVDSHCGAYLPEGLSDRDRADRWLLPDFLRGLCKGDEAAGTQTATYAV